MLDAIRDAAIDVIAAAANQTPETVLAMTQPRHPQLDAHQILYKAWRVLLEPDEYGPSPNVAICTEPILRAYYRTMDADDQKSEGSEDRFFKEQRNAIFPRHGLEVPGLFNKLFG